MPPIPRHDVYGPIHKALRKASTELLIRLGAADLADDGERAALVADLLGHIKFMNTHLWHEEEFIHPMIEARLPGKTAELDDDHRDHVERIERFKQSIRALEHSRDEAVDRNGAALYLEFSILIAHDLLHMHREECEIQPLLHERFSDEELRAAEGRIIASMAPPELGATLGAMLSAMNPPQRAGMVGGILAAGPADAQPFLERVVRPALTDTQWLRLRSDLQTSQAA